MDDNPLVSGTPSPYERLRKAPGGDWDMHPEDVESVKEMPKVEYLETMIPFHDKAMDLVYAYIKKSGRSKNHPSFGRDEVKLVWFSKVLENWKALVTTSLPDGMYYEVTYSGRNRDTNIDAYLVMDRFRIDDQDVAEYVSA